LEGIKGDLADEVPLEVGRLFVEPVVELLVPHQGLGVKVVMRGNVADGLAQLDCTKDLGEGVVGLLLLGLREAIDQGPEMADALVLVEGKPTSGAVGPNAMAQAVESEGSAVGRKSLLHLKLDFFIESQTQNVDLRKGFC